MGSTILGGAINDDDLNAKFDSLQGQIQSVLTQLGNKANNSTVTNLSSRVSALETTVNNLSTTVSNLSIKLDNLQTQVNNIDTSGSNNAQICPNCGNLTLVQQWGNGHVSSFWYCTRCHYHRQIR